MPYHPSRLLRIEQGFCIKCAKPRGETGTTVFCRTCANKVNEQTKKRTQYRLRNNLCLYCGKPLLDSDSGTHCPPCTKKRNRATREHRQRLKKAGKCVRCGQDKPLIEGKHCCETCYLKQVSVSHFHTVTKWEELKKIWDNQNGICPYTKRQIHLGIDASLDHVYPTSRFPELHENSNNWQWIYYRVNEMKKNMTPKEFIDFISNILLHFKVDALPYKLAQGNT